MRRYFGSYGAYDGPLRTKFATKKAFREAVLSNPGQVLIENNSIHIDPNDPDNFTTIRADQIGLDTSYGAIVGPCPFTRRMWYAVIVRKADGTFKVE